MECVSNQFNLGENRVKGQKYFPHLQSDLKFYLIEIAHCSLKLHETFLILTKFLQRLTLLEKVSIFVSCNDFFRLFFLNLQHIFVLRYDNCIS